MRIFPQSSSLLSPSLAGGPGLDLMGMMGTWPPEASVILPFLFFCFDFAMRINSR